jgi:hypothetical protein
LEKIDYYDSDGTLSSSNVFAYEKNRISKISNIAYNDRYEYTYKGSQLDEIKCYSGATLWANFKFTYDKGKISKVEYTSYDYDDYDYKFAQDDNCFHPLQFILPERIAKTMDNIQKKNISKSGSKGSAYTTTFTLTWTKKNVTKVECLSSDGLYTIEAKYDNCKNPFYGLIEEWWYDVSSCNNVIEETEREGSYYGMIQYNYNYDKKYPTSCTYTRKYAFEYSSETVTSTTEYEYVK